MLVVAVAVLWEVVADCPAPCPLPASEAGELVAPATRCEVVPCGALAEVVPWGARLDAAKVAVRVERMSLALRIVGLRCEKERWGLAAA